MSFLNKFFNKNESITPVGVRIPTPPPLVMESRSPETGKYAYDVGNRIMDRYDVVKIASGGMGVVYFCADQAQQQRPIALKTFKLKFLSSRKVRNSFLREGTIWVGLSHPNIVRAYGVERVGDGREIYLVLEWVAAAEEKEDASLRAWLDPDDPLPVEQALLFALHIARGMKYATTKIPGLVHRDLKPENVLVGRDGIARVTDFGLARALVDSKGETLGTGVLKSNVKRTFVSHGLVGTPLYMAPEQWQAHGQVDTRTDIYAFGCMLYEMVVGQPAIPGESLEELAQAHRFGLLRDIPAHLPLEVKAMIRRCVALNPHDRCQSWQEVEAATMIIYERVAGQPAPLEIETRGQEEKATRPELIAAGWSYDAMGMSYFDIGNYDLAAGYFERVIWLGRQTEDPPLEAAGLSHLGNACRSLSDLDGAIKYHKQQLKIARQIQAQAIEADALGNLGNDYAFSGDIKRAITYFQQQLGLAQAINDLLRESRALRNLADASRDLDNPQQAIAIYEQALNIARKLKDRTNEGRVLGNIGTIYARLDQMQKAVKFYEYAFKIAKEIGDRAGEGIAMGYLGIAYQKLGDLERSVMLLMKSLAIAKEVGLQVEEVRSLNHLGLLYLEAGDAEQGRQFFKEALPLARKAGNQLLWATVLWNTGNCYWALERYDQAIGYYEEYLTVAKDTQSLTQTVNAFYNLGNAYRSTGDQQRAHPYYEQALRLARQLQNERLVTEISVDFAVSLSMQGQRDRALYYAELALESFKKLNLKEAYRETKQIISEIRRQKPRP